MTGWDDPRQKSPAGDAWTLEDGCLKAHANPKITEDLFTQDTFGDFELVFDWRISTGGNSGVKYRIQDHVFLRSGHIGRFEDLVNLSLTDRRTDRPAKGQDYVIGFEYQILDNALNSVRTCLRLANLAGRKQRPQVSHPGSCLPARWRQAPFRGPGESVADGPSYGPSATDSPG